VDAFLRYRSVYRAIFHPLVRYLMTRFEPSVFTSSRVWAPRYLAYITHSPYMQGTLKRSLPCDRTTAQDSIAFFLAARMNFRFLHRMSAPIGKTCTIPQPDSSPPPPLSLADLRSPKLSKGARMCFNDFPPFWSPPPKQCFPPYYLLLLLGNRAGCPLALKSECLRDMEGEDFGTVRSTTPKLRIAP